MDGRYEVTYTFWIPDGSTKREHDIYAIKSA